MQHRYYIQQSKFKRVKNHYDLIAYVPEIGAYYVAFTWNTEAEMYLAGSVAMYQGNGHWVDTEGCEPVVRTQEFQWCDYILKQD